MKTFYELKDLSKLDKVFVTEALKKVYSSW